MRISIIVAPRGILLLFTWRVISPATRAMVAQTTRATPISAWLFIFYPSSHRFRRSLARPIAQDGVAKCELAHTAVTKTIRILIGGKMGESTGANPMQRSSFKLTSRTSKIAEAIVLLCLSSPVLAHDIYTNLRDQDGHLCCNGQDCKPVEARVLSDGNYYLPVTGETIPADMATPSPDNRFHHCTYHQGALIVNEFDRWLTWTSKLKTRCFFAPMHSW